MPMKLIELVTRAAYADRPMVSLRFEYTPLKQNDAKKLFPILIHGNEEEGRDEAIRVISYMNFEKRDDFRKEDHKIKSMNADEAYRTGHQGRLRGSPHGEKRDDFQKKPQNKIYE